MSKPKWTPEGIVAQYEGWLMERRHAKLCDKAGRIAERAGYHYMDVAPFAEGFLWRDGFKDKAAPSKRKAGRKKL